MFYFVQSTRRIRTIEKSKTIQSQQWPASISFSDTDSSFNVHLSKPFGNLQYSNPEIIQTELGKARYTVFANDADKELKLFISKSEYGKEGISKRTSNDILEMSATAFIHDLQGKTSISMPIIKNSTSQKFHGLRVFMHFHFSNKILYMAVVSFLYQVLQFFIHVLSQNKNSYLIQVKI